MDKRPLLKLMWSPRKALGVGGALLALGLAAPAAAETVYSWRTEDGGYAFTDDEKAIPERYRADAKPRQVGGLSGYERLTLEDPAATSRYAERLAARLDHLRRLNTPALRPAARPEGSISQTISLRTSNKENAPTLDIKTGGMGDEPIIVETLRARPRNKLVTRDNVVVRQGDRTIAIVRSRGREWNVADDIHVEEELE
jgi:hypothetical protein